MTGDAALRGPHSATPVELKARLEIEGLGGPYLILRDGDGTQLLVALPVDQAKLTVGRSNECDIGLPWDAQVSRVHVQLERVGEGWAIVDGGLSRNGSFLNGQRLVERRRLADGDLVQVGRTALLYRQPSATGMRVVTETVVASDGSPAPSVSPAQRAVLVALCRPFADGGTFGVPATNKQIGAELFLSLDAVKGHLRLLFSKFGLDELPQNEKRLRLAERALATGVVGRADLRSHQVSS